MPHDYDDGARKPRYDTLRFGPEFQRNLANQRANHCVASAHGARIAHFAYIRPAQHGRIIHYGYIDDKLYGVVGSAFAAGVAHLAIITAGRRDPP
jgi:hypothetical protein